MRNLDTKSLRYYDTFTRTYYSTKDRRKVIATVKITKHSDGREYRSIRVNDTREWHVMENQIRSTFTKLLK